ncbi:rCG24736 [Rattus norvegicus]|uniref:RCG24736 n=1 Tax=Rattus norvegicus TaxID=10116 RepID=A6JCC2_RAT|nr:rCG24736 [Rattus norvegicus]
MERRASHSQKPAKCSISDLHSALSYLIL